MEGMIMPLIINTNVQSLNSQRQLVKSGMEMSTAMERLSSGKRINSAGDDAAGLAIASRMTSQVRGLSQAVRNANDGISLIQTAGGALEESNNILQRMRELAIQSANGIYTDANRTSLNAELEQLKSELSRIAETTSFNGLNILDGSLGEIALQVGSESNQTIGINIGSGFDAASLGTAGAVATDPGTYTLSQSTNGNDGVSQQGTSGSLATLTEGQLLINGIEVSGAEQFDTSSSTDNGASALGISEAINSISDQTGVTATATTTANLGEISFTNYVDLGAFVGAGNDGTAAEQASLTGSGTAITFPLDISSGADLNFTVTIGDTTQLVDVVDGDGTTGAMTSTQFLAAVNVDLTNITASFDGSGNLVLTQDAGQGSPGDVITVGQAGGSSDLTTIGMNTSTSVTQSDAENTLTVAEGEFFINGFDMYDSGTNTYATNTIDAFVAALNDKTGDTGVTFSTDGTKLFASTSDGSDVVITTTGTLADADNGTFTLGGTDLTAATTITGSSVGFDLGAGALVINGTDIGATVTGVDTKVTSQEDLVSLINAKAATTGVTAEINADDELVLTAADGRNIEIETDGSIDAATDLGDASPTYQAGMTLAGDIDVNVANTGYTYAGVVTLNGSGFELSGENTSGFKTTETVSALQTEAADDTFTAMTNGDLTINGYTVDFAGVATETDSNVDNDASALQIATAINSTAGLKDEVTATATTVMNLGLVSAGTLDSASGAAVAGVDIKINGSTTITIEGDVLDGDSNGLITGAINSQLIADGIDVVASVNENNELILTSTDGLNIDFELITNQDTGGDKIFENFALTQADNTQVVTKGTISLEAKSGFSVGEIGGNASYLAGLENTNGSVATTDISTQDGAQAAISIFDAAIEEINDATGALGAANNRLDFTVANLSSIIENATASRSTIMDADFAAETAALSRAQVLQQAASAMLAQANALPSQVLSLLR